ncbi:carboxypeptidase-like regulatory domain-containing protein [uncultured Methanobrevibacter sp.]|uniref:carboxypeptidase-like regulatory domain-containing protein n=1 Tax=uncultured Methanobrevibacter sp. TaxID=253161 RepID=UPI002621CA8E|nr:carboxypeptidase-like regulatory domain-containing protein [uncultured Methanobrevibacter sp.]
MLNKKVILISILLVAILSVSFVSASDNVTSDENTDYLASAINESDVLSDSQKTFAELDRLINDNSNTRINLDNDYKFSISTDSALTDGILINRSISIYGNGHTIDANNQARIFNVTSYVNFYNVFFINANADSGSAITGINYYVSGCSFINNHADKMGGAMVGGFAQSSTFRQNSAGRWGGAVYKGSIEDCTFIANSAEQGGALYDTYATVSRFINNTAGLYGGAMYGNSVGYSVFTGNTAKSHAGAVFNAYVLKCNFTRNSAPNGGALGGESYSAQNCIFEENTADDGGAMYGGDAYDCIFKNNQAHQGGAKFSGSAVSCIFDSNKAVSNGGAIMETYAVTCNFTYNTAINGGAMYQNSAKNSIFMFNSAVNGGAISNGYSDSCKFYNNTATSHGGAVNEGGSDSSDFRYNHAVNGGAVWGSTGGSMYVYASTFISNTADEYGGAIYETAAIGCLFSKNTAKYGGALALGSASKCTFRNNVAKVTGGVRYNSYVADTVECVGNLPEFKIYVSDFTGIEGFGGDINIKMYDNPNYPVTGVNATIKLYNSKNKLIKTEISEVGYNWFINLAAGKYKAVITVDDADLFEVDSVKVSITIKKSSFIYAANVVTNYRAGKLLIINLHDSAGKVIKYAKISVKLNGATKSYTTDENGQIMVATKSLAPGTYSAEITYSGSDTYMKSTAVAKVTVNKLTPKLTAAKATLKLKDKTKKYTVTLKNNKKVVMKSTKVTITVNKKTYSVKTNSKGQAIFKLTKLTKKGTYSATVKYAGSSIYKPVSKKVKITIK